MRSHAKRGNEIRNDEHLEPGSHAPVWEPDKKQFIFPLNCTVIFHQLNDYGLKVHRLATED